MSVLLSDTFTRARGFVIAFAAFSLALGAFLAGSVALEGIDRSKDPLGVAERICNQMLKPGEADSPLRHQCIQREVARPAFSLRRFLPSLAATLLGGTLLFIAVAARIRSRTADPRVKPPG